MSQAKVDRYKEEKQKREKCSFRYSAIARFDDP